MPHLKALWRALIVSVVCCCSPGPTNSEDVYGHDAVPPDLATALMCRDIAPQTRSIVDQLTTHWGTAPAAICPYEWTLLSSTACGGLSENSASFCAQDSQLAWDDHWLQGLHDVHGDFAVQVVLAHEWGHLNQHTMGTLAVRPMPQVELHADCQLGAFVAATEPTPADAAIEFEALCNGLFSTSRWPDLDHGDCQTRRVAFEMGYDGWLDNTEQGTPINMVFALCSAF